MRTQLYIQAYKLFAKTGTAIMMIAVFHQQVFSTTYQATSVTQLNSLAASAKKGDIITMKDGTYTGTVSITNNAGITVSAITPGGVIITGASKASLSADNLTFEGFQFKNCVAGTTTNLVNVDGSNIILNNINFNGNKCTKFLFISAASQYVTVSNCNFENKITGYADDNCVVQVYTNANTPSFHTFRYCTFINMPGDGGDFGNEPIRIGLSTQANNSARCIVEYCFFSKCTGADTESISIKSSDNICRYNTFSDNPISMMVFRHGNRNTAYGNFFLKGSGGIRVKEGVNHSIYNNYFDSGSGVAFQLDFVADGGPTTPTGLNNINIDHNTFYSGTTNFATGPKNVTFANNIFKNTTQPSQSYITNLGNTSKPVLSLNSDGYYEIGSGSPCIDKANGTYPALIDIAGTEDDPTILKDITGRARPATKTLKDVGATEFNATGTKINKPLTVNETGPTYLRQVVITELEDISLENKVSVFPNPSNGTFVINAKTDAVTSIINAFGAQVAVLSLVEGRNDVSISLASGIYFVKIERDVFKLMIE